MDISNLIEVAKTAKNMAYAPYTKFKVGAALATKSGKIYSGCNIENYGIMSICAERVAFCKALSEGEKEFEAIAVVGSEALTTPCGYCRQFMTEFADENFKVYVVYGSQQDQIKEYTLSELLPHTYKMEE